MDAKSGPLAWGVPFKMAATNVIKRSGHDCHRQGPAIQKTVC